MDSTAKHLTELIRYEICGDVPEIGNFSDEELKNIFLLSKKHDLAHMAGDALLKLNCCNSETKKKFQYEIITAVYSFEKLEITLADIRFPGAVGNDIKGQFARNIFYNSSPETLQCNRKLCSARGRGRVDREYGQMI